MTSDNNTTMLVQPAGWGGNCNGGGWGGGMFGGDFGALIILFFLFAMFGGGWGGLGGGMFGGMGGGMFGGFGAQQMFDTRLALQDGFNNQAVVGKLDGITRGICDATYAAQTTAMNGFHGVDKAICDLGVTYMQGNNALSRQIGDCCCETREAISGVRYDMATQACDIKSAIYNSTRDIVDSQNNGTRAILDRLNQDKIDSLMAENQSLKLAASQANQNAALGAMMDANTAEILRRAAPVPVPSYQVPNPNAGIYYGGCNACAC